MRRATSGASIGPLSKQLTPILSVAAHEGPYAFKFKGLTLWLAKTPRLKLLGAFRGTAHISQRLRRPRQRPLRQARLYQKQQDHHQKQQNHHQKQRQKE